MYKYTSPCPRHNVIAERDVVVSTRGAAAGRGRAETQNGRDYNNNIPHCRRANANVTRRHLRANENVVKAFFFFLFHFLISTAMPHDRRGAYGCYTRFVRRTVVIRVCTTRTCLPIRGAFFETTPVYFPPPSRRQALRAHRGARSVGIECLPPPLPSRCVLYRRGRYLECLSFSI